MGFSKCISILVILLFSLSVVVSAQQKGAIAISGQNVVYCGIGNPLNVASVRYKKNEIFLSTDNGRISVDYGRCEYTPSRPGRARVFVEKKDASVYRAIDTFVFLAKELPPPVLRFGGKTGGEMPASSIRVQIAPAAMLDGFDFDAKYAVTKFRILFFRDSEVVADRTLRSKIGCRFSDDRIAEAALKDVKPGDAIWLKEVEARRPDGRTTKLNDLILYAK